MSAHNVLELALYAHQYVTSENPDVPDPPINETQCCATAALDALKAAGYAVIELPKPVVGLDWDWCAVLSPKGIDDLVNESGVLTVAEARSKAAALLAAADAAEAVTE